MGTKINTINLDSKYINSLKYDEIIKGFNNPNITEFSFSCIEVFHEFLYMFQDEAKDLAKIKYLTFNGYFSDINDFYLIDQTKELFRKFLTGIKKITFSCSDYPKCFDISLVDGVWFDYLYIDDSIDKIIASVPKTNHRCQLLVNKVRYPNHLLGSALDCSGCENYLNYISFKDNEILIKSYVSKKRKEYIKKRIKSREYISRIYPFHYDFAYTNKINASTLNKVLSILNKESIFEIFMKKMYLRISSPTSYIENIHLVERQTNNGCNVYLNSKNKNFKIDGSFLFDTRTNTPILINTKNLDSDRKVDKVIVPPSINDPLFNVPEFDNMLGHPKEIKMDFTKNNFYFYNHYNQLIHSETRTLVSLPDDEQINLYSIKKIKPGALAKKEKVKRVYIDCEIYEPDIIDIVHELDDLAWEKSNKNENLEIILPVEWENVLQKIRHNLLSNRAQINIIYKDVEVSPVFYIE